MKRSLSIFLILLNFSYLKLYADTTAFVAVKHDSKFVLPEIIYPDNGDQEANFDYATLSQKISQVQDHYIQQDPAFEAVRYLHDALEKMAGREFSVVSRKDKSRGIVLSLLAQAPKDVQDDPEVKAALKNTGEDIYNANEAFFVRTEPERILIVANTVEGLNHGVVELLESVGYEALGIGPNWTYIPNFHDKPLIFHLKAAERPSFYLRDLGLTSGQGHGIGTLFQKTLPNPDDESVEVSYNRWTIGARTIGKSMARFLGHSFQKYHKAVFEKMQELKTDVGFMGSVGKPVEFVDGKLFLADGNQQHSLKLDVSIPFVREILLEDFKKRSEEHFSKLEKGQRLLDSLFIFGTDPEDGIFPEDTVHIHFPNWYPEYLEKENIPFGKAYVLHGFRGLDQAKEIWDPKAFADHIFALNNWLLHEYDKWIDSLPLEEQVTIDGTSKKELVRTSLLSYNCHDVPPDFDLDPRIRVMIAGFPKNRGFGKWKAFSTQAAVGEAFSKLLPREPAGNYLIPSIAYYRDYDISGIRGSSLSKTVHQKVSDDYKAGFRAVHLETDLNFGKLGLEYYLTAKMLWNANLTVEELDHIRDRWFQRAFGSGWQEMKAYYDFMAPETSRVNSPNSWARAIRFIDAADKKINPQKEPAVKRRLDDLKQYWYYYYLKESNLAISDPALLKEFLWKGQMSYMTAMHMVAQRYFKNTKIYEIVGEPLNKGAAHYTAQETAVWWKKILEFWPLIPVTEFASVRLNNGKMGAEIDTNDLVAVKEFQTEETPVPYFYHSASQNNTSFLSVATKPGSILGFKLTWPFNPNNDGDNDYRDKSIFYGISRWNPKTREWDELADISMNSAQSRPIEGKDGKVYQRAELAFKAPLVGTYRFKLGYGGNLANLEMLTDENGQATSSGFTFYEPLAALHQPTPFYIYIPKGTKTFDLEVWGGPSQKILLLHTGTPLEGLKKTREVDISALGVHCIPLEPGEDGSVAQLINNGICFPYLHSVPFLWAKFPSALLIPREIAEADGLTIIE